MRPDALMISPVISDAPLIAAGREELGGTQFGIRSSAPNPSLAWARV